MVAVDVLTTLISANAGFDLDDDDQDIDRRTSAIADASDYIVDIREYDVPYHVRVAIDRGERYNVILLGQNKLTSLRYSNRKVVHGRSEARRYESHMHRRKGKTSRPCGYGIRHRDD